MSGAYPGRREPASACDVALPQPPSVTCCQELYGRYYRSDISERALPDYATSFPAYPLLNIL
jgi:hypothetical protein